MKRKSGFTLVELLAVIVVLAIVLLIAVPGVLAIIEQTKNRSYESQLKIIKEAARIYVTTMQPTWMDQQVVVNLTDLQGQGLVDKRLIDPRDKTEMKGIAVVVSKQGKQMKYDIVYTDSSNANYPVYRQGMIPIRYDGTNWVKADPTNEDRKWFDYSKQQWANVATVTEDVRQEILNAPDGTVVPMDKINTMFVWIPRFKYKLFNVDGTVSPVGNKNLVGDYLIDVQFEGSAVSKATGMQNGSYLTHPAFTFGTQELGGFWMAKFEVAYNQGDASSVYTKEGAQHNEVLPNQMLIKPSLPGWGTIMMGNAYKTCFDMKNGGNVFGFTNTMETHLMKNMEWTAVTYLIYSNYGKQGNSNYSGAEKQVMINNNSDGKTGCGAESQGAASTTDCHTYETAQGQASSSTGNVSGVYGMTGGQFDMTMAMYSPTTNALINLSQFTKEELDAIVADGRRIDVYTDLDQVASVVGFSKFGDGLEEMGPYNIVAAGRNFSPWHHALVVGYQFPDMIGIGLLRGGSYIGTTDGAPVTAYPFLSTYGSAHYGFRPVVF